MRTSDTAIAEIDKAQLERRATDAAGLRRVQLGDRWDPSRCSSSSVTVAKRWLSGGVRSVWRGRARLPEHDETVRVARDARRRAGESGTKRRGQHGDCLHRLAGDDDQRRECSSLSGELFVFSPGPSSAALCALAREMAEEAFAPHDPPVAQDTMDVEDYAKILADSSHDSSTIRGARSCIRGTVAEVGCDLEKTYFDVPRLRTMAHGEYMKAGLALPVPSASRYVVLGSVRTAQLVAAGLRDRGRKLDGVPPRVLRPVDRQQLVGLRLRGMEPNGKAAGRAADQAGHSESAEGRGSARARRGRPGCHAGRRRPDLLGRTTPLDGPEHDESDAIQHRLPNGQPRRSSRTGDSTNIDAACTGTTLGDFVRASDLEPLPDDVIESYWVVASGAV